MAYIDTPLNPIVERLVRQSVNNAIDPLVQTMRAIGLNNGRELKYYLAPKAEGKITVPEILEFMQMQVDSMRTTSTSWPHDYCVGYRDAIEAIYLYIKKRIDEDSKKKEEVNANCC